MRIFFILSMLFYFKGNAQDYNAPINRMWVQYASDTSLTYRQITNVCDSMFSEAGFTIVDTSNEASDSALQKEDGNSYWNYPVVPDVPKGIRN